MEADNRQKMLGKAAGLKNMQTCMSVCVASVHLGGIRLEGK